MITIVCVNYNSYSELDEFIITLKPYALRYNIKLVIVDNSEQKNIEYIKSLDVYKFITYLDPNANLGYFGAALYGYEYIYNIYKKVPEWFIISNVDILISMDIFAYLDKIYSNGIHPNTAILAPSIFSDFTGGNLNPYMIKKPSKKKIDRLLIWYSNYMLYNLYNILAILKKKFVKKKISQFDEVIIYAGHGSFVIIKDIYFLNGGSLKYQNYLFYEEVFLAEEARKINCDILFTNEISVIHKEHINTGKYFRSRIIYKFHIAALRNIANTYFKS